jgi:ribosomal protein S18 acetylase RimI-like enzyme
MILELKNKSAILPRLYEDFVLFVEEIALIEETYLWRNVTVFVDDEHSMREFLLLHSPSVYWDGKSLSAYMTAENPVTVRKFASILKEKKNLQTHLETSAKANYVKQLLPWLDKNYTVRYCRADLATFKPHYKHRRNTVQLTPQNIKQFQPSADSHFVKRLETAPAYGYVTERGELVATSGVGFLTQKSFSISYTETKPEYRGRGIAKCLTALACEPLIKMGLIGVYAADVTNQPSLEVARGLGFEPYRDLKCFYTVH